MGRMAELAAEQQNQEEPGQTTLRCFFTIYTTDGKEWESIVQELDETRLEKWGEVLADLKKLGHLFFPVHDALGRHATMHFHPEKIVAIRITEVTL